MNNILNISILDGMTFDLTINKIIKYEPLQGSNSYHVFLLRSVSENSDEKLFFLGNNFEQNNQQESDNLSIHRFQDAFESNLLSFKSYELKTNHHIYKLVKYSSPRRNTIIKILDVSNNDPNKNTQWIQSGVQIKVKPRDIDYLNLVHILRLW
jgi:hypothetical protein